MKDKDYKMLKDINIKMLVIHCSDTPDDSNLNASDIHQMHLGFGWDGIGYHKIISRDGKTENSRPEYWLGAHAFGFNDSSLGVCLLGRKHFTNYQFKSLELILRKWKEKYPEAKIIGHYNVSTTNKTCPNFDVDKWCKERELS